MSAPQLKTVLVTGGAGYVGARLVPALLAAGHDVRVLDLYWFGEDVLDPVKDAPGLTQIKGDLRDAGVVRNAVAGVDAVIHLACISNDPSFELNPGLGRSINFDCFEPLVRMSKEAGVRRFIYASSSSVYGVSDQPNVNEDHPLRPLTDYSKFKEMCEPILLGAQDASFVPMVVRPATLCGYSRRQRLDLTVNILTHLAFRKRRITVFGGDQMRPNLHIEDMVDLYKLLLTLPDAKIAGRIYNAGYDNFRVSEIAAKVKAVVEAEIPGAPVEIVTTPTDDNRSYHISSERIGKDLGFYPSRTLEDAMRDLIVAFRDGLLPNSETDARYYNIKTMQQAQVV
ncbi:MAG: NAD-dependent epimerase/dehydratase family protein [Vicinamibacterales bacterium]